MRTARALRASFWLGWLIESNWLDPLLFFIYMVARPLGSALILVFMFFVVAQGRSGPMLHFFLIGSAFWPFVLMGFQGLGTAVIADREHYRMLKYVYIAPAGLLVFLAGRGLSRLASASAATAVTLAVGVAFLELPLRLEPGGLALLLLATALGWLAILGMALGLAGLILNLTEHSWSFPEAVVGTLYLFCGTVFPVGVLPQVLQPLARLIPLAYWLEACRRALLPPGAVLSFPQLSDAQVLAALTLSTVAWVIGGYAVFRLGEGRARQRGLIDQESHF